MTLITFGGLSFGSIFHLLPKAALVFERNMLKLCCFDDDLCGMERVVKFYKETESFMLFE